MPGDAVDVGRIVDAWGIKGWVRVQPHAADPHALFSSKRWYLRPPAGPRRPGDLPLPPLLRITEARRHGAEVVAGIRDVDDRSAAEALRGARIFIARSSFPTAGADEYYWVDLIGLAVVNRAGDALGEVVGLIDNGAHAVLRVQPAAAVGEPPAAQRLIPFVAAYVDAVDLGARRIVVDWGLDY
jgi:16S rRNA processing protein RimM